MNGSLMCPISEYSVYNLSLYIKGNCSSSAYCLVAVNALYIQTWLY